MPFVSFWFQWNILRVALLVLWPLVVLSSNESVPIPALKIGLLQVQGGRDYGTRNITACYCLLHVSVQCIFQSTTLVGGMAAIAKLHFLKHHLSHFDWVVSLDADAIPANFALDIGGVLRQTLAHVVLTPSLALQSSVVAVRNSTQGHRFLEDVIFSAGTGYWHCFEQAAVQFWAALAVGVRLSGCPLSTTSMSNGCDATVRCILRRWVRSGRPGRMEGYSVRFLLYSEPEKGAMWMANLKAVRLCYCDAHGHRSWRPGDMFMHRVKRHSLVVDGYYRKFGATCGPAAEATRYFAHWGCQSLRHAKCAADR
eukprot:RCo006381